MGNSLGNSGGRMLLINALQDFAVSNVAILDSDLSPKLRFQAGHDPDKAVAIDLIRGAVYSKPGFRTFSGLGEKRLSGAWSVGEFRLLDGTRCCVDGRKSRVLTWGFGTKAHDGGGGGGLRAVSLAPVAAVGELMVVKAASEFSFAKVVGDLFVCYSFKAHLEKVDFLKR